MEDKYFDKKIKSILESPPAMRPDANALADMKRRLDNINTPREHSSKGLLWLLPLLILPFLFGTLFFYQKYQNLNQEINKLQSQFTQLNQNKIQNNYITYHYDTIYRTIYKDKIIERQFEKTIVPPPPILNSYFAYNNSNGYHPQHHQVLTDFSFLKKGIFNSIDDQLTNGRGFVNGKNLGLKGLTNFIELEATDKNLDAIDYLSLNPLNHNNELNVLDEKLNDVHWKVSKKNTNPIFYVIPTGINAGVDRMQWVRGNTGSKNFSGSSYGVNGSLEFPRGVEMQIGAEWLGLSFELKAQDDLSSFPTLPPDNPGDLFKELKVGLSYIQIPVVIKKYFRDKKSLQPMFGIGFVAYRPLKQKFSYEYINSSLVEYNSSQSFSDGDFSANNLRFNLGGRYSFRKRYIFQAEATYQHAFEQGTGEYFKLQYWALNLGMRYRFSD